MTGISLEISVFINAPVEKVWDALVNPELIKKYLFGTTAISDWQEGSSLVFKGEWNGKEYLDKGTILKIEPNKVLKYSYYSSFSNLEDKEENYQVLTFTLAPENNGTKLILTQENIATEESKQHSEENWKSVLKTIKNLLE